MGGENLAVDLADTLVTVTTPPTDLIADQAASDPFTASCCRTAGHGRPRRIPAGCAMRSEPYSTPSNRARRSIPRRSTSLTRRALW